MSKFGKPVKAKKKELSAKTMTEGQTYVGVYEGQQQVKSHVAYNFADLDLGDNTTGEITLFWGSSDLNHQMAHAEVGDKVTITYKGKTNSNSAKGFTHIFDVEIQKPLT